MTKFKESSMASFAKEHGIYGKSIEEKIEEKVKSKYSKSVSEGSERSEVIENPRRKLMPRTFVLHKKPPEANGFDTVVSYELVVYTITETLPNPPAAKINFLKVVSGQIAEQNEVNMSIGVARRHWKVFKEKGWTELPKTSWPKWLEHNAQTA